MIKTAFIQNFQPWEKLRIDFDAGVTSFVGPSDVGKSAVFRALRWVAQNTPQGIAFIREGQPGATVRLEIDDHSIVRKRGRTGDNLYLMGGSEFKAFGTGVPDAIAKVLNVSDVNFQSQHDSSFWLSQSAGEVSRQLNAVVDLSVIDSTLQEINRRYRAADQNVQMRRDALTSAKHIKISLSWAVEADVALKVVEDAANAAAAAKVSAALLRSACQTAGTQRSSWQTAKAHLDQLVRVGRAAGAAMKVQERRLALVKLVQQQRGQQRILDVGCPDTSRLEELRRSVGDVRRLASVVAIRDRITSVRRDSVIVRRGFPDLDGLTACRETYDNAVWMKKDLKVALNYIRDLHTDIGADRAVVQKAEAELLEKTGGMCPVCNQPMSVL